MSGIRLKVFTVLTNGLSFGYSTLILDILKAVVPIIFVKNYYPDLKYYLLLQLH